MAKVLEEIPGLLAATTFERGMTIPEGECAQTILRSLSPFIPSPP